MTVRQILKFHITCDGMHPTKGSLCGCDITVEAPTQRKAEQHARDYGWRKTSQGWLCNARDGHQ